MLLARGPRARRRRPTTGASLRALATLVAVLVGLSALGQFAHFFLVPHALCAEHGELLELSAPAGHAASHAPPVWEESAHASGELAAEHEHCQLLARGQREQAAPSPPKVLVLPTLEVTKARPDVRRAPRVEVIPALSLAPKTSPPFALAG